MRQYTQLNLRIISRQQHTARRSTERLAQSPPHIRPHRNILQIGVGGRKTAGGRNRLIKRGMQAAIVSNQRLQALSIGTAQF